MKNLFCSHTPSEENIKEVANELGLFQNVHLLACDINDVKVILNVLLSAKTQKGINIPPEAL